MKAAKAFARLVEIMARLRNPDGGCPWDLEQTFETIVPYTIEEAYEVAEAIRQGDRTALCEELGDLLLQVVYHARMAEEEGAFDVADVADAIASKMIRRHPHVFGDATIRSAEEQTRSWEEMKARERAGKAQADQEARHSALDGVATALPALVRAQKIQSRAARVGFDWEKAEDVLPKIEEEVAEIREVMAADHRDDAHARDRLEDEVGDLLFAVVNLARQLDLDAEAALRRATAKFEGRFRAMEEAAGDGFAALDLTAKEALWQRVKRKDGAGS